LGAIATTCPITGTVNLPKNNRDWLKSMADTTHPPNIIQLWHNVAAQPRSRYGAELRQILNLERAIAAMAELTQWPGYGATPLRSLSGLSEAIGVGQIAYKDESNRFGLGSFKALGGAYAVLRQVTQQVRQITGDPTVSFEAVRAGGYAEIVAQLVMTTATDGNHGRSVAWGAQQLGCPCVIFIHERVSVAREKAIAQYGATVIRVPGNYDSAVRWADAQAAANGWILLSDTSYAGYTEIPCDVMQGYTLMVEEVLQQWPQVMASAPPWPTHVFIQAGVGGLAAAVCAHLWERWEVAPVAGRGDRPPRLIVVEPATAACLYETACHGELVDVHGSLETLMGCLSAGRPSLLAWDILKLGAEVFMTIPDELAAHAMRLLADGIGGDRPIVAGESGAAGLAALLGISQQPELRSQIHLDENSRILLFGTEGAMDPEVYQQIVSEFPSP